ncbi:65-kDa microtubule-associated protein 3-like [Silene latifolia]|uniref:65-kDa microtubule-associated protein 3-like n=1 Tax=Silene latifolia TaxID=37657 RepID=UPI003D7817A1
MANIRKNPLQQIESTCESLLCELQVIWDDVGESEATRDKQLVELEQECLDVYRRKVDQANRCRAQIRQAIADSEAELAAICSAIGELPVHFRQGDQKAGSLKEELSVITPQLEHMRNRKIDRKKQFLEVIGQIQKLSTELYGSEGVDLSKADVNENELSLRKLEELQTQLQSVQEEKRNRVRRVIEHLSGLSSLCSVLGFDFKETIGELHPSLADAEETRNISTETLQQLECAIVRLREQKLQRMQRLQDLATMLLELWNLMDTPVEEQHAFQNVTCNIAASEDEITGANMLSEDFIKHVEAEVCRLEELKSSKLKELVLGKRAELEEICRKTHMVLESDTETEHLIEAIESGAVDPASVLEQIESDIGKVKEEAFSRKEILEKVEKWLSAREEEEWLEEYNLDENRYNTGKGSHLILKRAEKARTLASKLPGMAETLTAKIITWENERADTFLYDGSPLLSVVEEYITVREEKDQEKKRHREQKKLQGQLTAEQEAPVGSKPSSLKNLKKSSRISIGGGNKRAPAGGSTLQTPRPSSSQSNRGTPNSRPSKNNDDSAAQSTAKRALDIANLPMKNYSFNGRESEPAVARSPFSLISSTSSSTANGEYSDEQNIPQEQQQNSH